MTIEIIQSKLLVVEGIDEQFFFEALINHQNLQNIQILPIGGKTKLKENLKMLAKSSEFHARVNFLGIVRDADTNASDTFRSVCDALQNAGLSVPANPMELTSQNPKITVMVIPHGSTRGMLEDLCLTAVISDPATPCMEQYFQCLQQLPSSLPKNMSKAKVHAFLASRYEPDKRLGEAAKAGYWPWDNEAFATVKSFLQQIVS